MDNSKNNDLQNTIQTNKKRGTLTHQKAGMNSCAPEGHIVPTPLVAPSS